MSANELKNATNVIHLIRNSFIKRKIFLCSLLLLAFGLRLHDLGNAPVRWDEAYSVWLSKLNVLDSTDRVTRASHPPLFNAFFHIWARLVGSSEFASRAQAVLFAAMTSAGVYALVRSLTNYRLAAYLALLLITLSPFHIHWSQDARMYGLVTMLATIALCAYWRNRTMLLIFAGLGAALTHVFGGIILVCIFAHRLAHWRSRNNDRRQFISAFAIIIPVYAVWAIYAYARMRGGASFAVFEPGNTIRSMAANYLAGSGDINPDLDVALLLCAAAFFLGLALQWKENRYAVSLILIGCILPLILIVILTSPAFPLRVGFIRDRHYIIFAPFVFAGLAMSLTAFSRLPRLQWFGVAVSVGLLTLYAYLSALQMDARYFRDDVRSLMGAVELLTNSRDRVYVTTGRNLPFLSYHLDRAGMEASRNADPSRPNLVGIPTDAPDVPAMMEWLVAGFPRFWVVEFEAHLDEPHLSPEGPIKRMDWLDETHNLLYQIDYGWYNSFSYYSRIEGEVFDRNLNDILPPVVTEARPGDFVRIGVPAGTSVELVHEDQLLESRSAETWYLHQFYIPNSYPNGNYALRLSTGQTYSFMVSHSQEN